jgi:hypothetical protein
VSASARSAGPSSVASAGTLRPDSLRTYLNDHAGGAAAGCRLAARLARALDDPALARLETEIRRDRASLQRLIHELGITRSWGKEALGAMGEVVSRLKLRVAGSRDGVERLLGVEALTVGIEGKLRLWRSLEVVAASDPRLDAAPLAQLARRAELQLEAIEEVRLRLAEASLTR